MNANETITIQDLEVDLTAFHGLSLSKAFNLQGNIKCSCALFNVYTERIASPSEHMSSAAK